MRQLPDSYPFAYIPVICGPTASGKSSLALELCKLIDGELVSCDSMQIYKTLNVGTAKPDESEQREIKHHLIDIIDPGTNFSVNDFLTEVIKVIDEILSRGKVPVLCGGTGQYISAIKDGITYVSEPVPDELVNSMFKKYEEIGNVNSLYEELQNIDPEAAAKIHPNNIRRVIRAMAVYRSTGKTFTEWNKNSKKTGPVYPFKLFELDYEDYRDILYDRINSRVDVMMEQGLLKEAQDLYSLNIDHKSTCFQAIGYKEFAPYFSGEIPLEKAIYDIKLNSRHYAKRQLTWFRYLDDIIKLSINDSSLDNAKLIVSFIKL